MSEITVGSVGVEVVPNAKNFATRIRAEVTPDAAKIGQEFGKRFGEAAERQMARGVKDGLDEGARGSSAKAAKQGAEYGGAFAKALRSRLEAALKNLPDVKITADSSDADKEIAEIRKDLATLRDKRIGIDIDAGRATAEIGRLQERMGRLSRDSADIQVRVNAGAASAELASVLAEVRRLDGRTAKVRVDADTAGASAQLALMRGTALGVSTGVAAISAAVGFLGVALIPIAAAGAGAMAAIAGGALAAASGVGVLILALAPVIAAVQAVRQAHDQSAQSARSSTNAHLQMASAMDGVRSAQRALASAEEDARVSRVRAAEQIQAAQRRLADEVRKSAADQVEAARRVEDAERDLAQAQRDSLDAIQALNDAREQAARDQEDLASRVANGALDEREAVIRLAEAQERLAEVQRDPNATELDRQRAKLAVDEAIQGLQDQQRENRRLAAEKKAADEAGINGSKRVQDAQDNLRGSQERLKDAQRGVSDAVAAGAEVQRRSAERVADAQRALARAQQDAADSQRRSAEAVVAAQQAVVSAQRGVQQASQSAGATGGAALDKVRTAMDALSPAGQRFVTFLNGTLIPALSPLSKAAQQGLLPGLQTALSALVPVIPAISRFVGTLAKALGDLAVEAAESLGQPVWREFFAYMSRTAGPIIVTIARVLGNLAAGFAGLLVAFEPVTQAFYNGLLRLSRAFADFGANAATSSGFQGFLAYVREVGPQVVATFAALGRALGHILASLAPMGPVVLAIVRGFAGFITALPPRVIQALAVAFIALSVAIAVTNIAVTALAAGAVGLIVAGVVVAIGVIVAWALAFKKLYEENETFRTVVTAVWTFLRDLIVTAWQSVILPTFQAIAAFITGTLIPVFREQLLPVVQAVWRGIQVAFQVAWVIAKAIFDGYVSYIRNIVAPVFLFLWRNVVQPVWTGIQIAITVAWAAIQVVFRAIQIQVAALSAIFLALLNNVFRPVWSGISAAVSTAWNAIRPIFQALGSIIETQVAPAFRRGVDAITAAWESIREKAKAPVRFVVETILNKGIIGTFNKLAGYFGVDPVAPIELPKGFARGGYISGPGGPREDLIPAMLSNGEFVVNAAAVKKLGVPFLSVLNRADQYDVSGDVAGLVAERVARNKFADGGLVNRIKSWLPSVDPKPYIWGGVGPNGWDCSGLVGTVWAMLNDRAPYRRYFTTSSGFDQFGFERGPGLFTMGVVPGQHMAGNLAGLPFEAASTKSGIHVGSSARSVGSFPSIFHLKSLPGGGQLPSGEAPKGINILDPLGSVKSLFTGLLGQVASIATNPFGRLVAAVPGKLVEGAIHKISDALPGFDVPGVDIPGFAAGGLVRKYDQGGYLPPGVTLAYNATGKPEPVFTAQQFDRIKSAGDGSRVVNVGPIYNPVPETASETTTRTMRRLAYLGPAAK